MGIKAGMLLHENLQMHRMPLNMIQLSLARLVVSDRSVSLFVELKIFCWPLPQQPLSLLLKTSPLISELALYDVVNTPGVEADLSNISRPAVCIYKNEHTREWLTRDIENHWLSAKGWWRQARHEGCWHRCYPCRNSSYVMLHVFWIQ